MKYYDYLIVGAGLYGATFAYCAKQKGKKCLLIDKRLHLGGNLFCEQIEGINVHKYGPHIFHTSSKQVWDFVNHITQFNQFINSPLANYKGHIYNLPFNMNTFNQIWGIITPKEAIEKIKEQKAEIKKHLGASSPSNLEEQALSLVGKDIYEILIKEYTEKQWGRPCCELPAFIIQRLPIRYTYDNNYFNDTYQGIPIGGYNQLINGLVEGIDYILDLDFFLPHNSPTGKSLCNTWKEIADKLVYTGPLDAYFNYKYGKLDWRTIRFQTRVEDTPNYQGNAVINYTSHEKAYTRVIEHKHFEMFGDMVYSNPKTVISEEYPTEYTGEQDPYYPINDAKNSELANKYKKLAEQEKDVILGGRLGNYQYLDMAPIIEEILHREDI